MTAKGGVPVNSTPGHQGFHTIDVVERIRAAIEVNSQGCWLWQRALNHNGYGQIQYQGKKQAAHRVAYEVFVGPIPAGLQIDHLCRVRPCVNPEHLEAVSPRENTLRTFSPVARNAVKTHCPAGHPLNGKNLYLAPSRRRVCRTCAREASRRYTARKKAA